MSPRRATPNQERPGSPVFVFCGRTRPVRGQPESIAEYRRVTHSMDIGQMNAMVGSEIRMLRHETVTLVQASFAHIAPIADTVARTFYQRLFERKPSLRTLFSEDMSDQRVKLMKTLGMTVDSLERPERIVPALRHMGRRHAGYGVKDEHYELVGEALLFALQQGLGEVFTTELRDAWVATYDVVARTMRQAANEAEREAASDIDYLPGECDMHQRAEQHCAREQQRTREHEAYISWLQSSTAGF